MVMQLVYSSTPLAFAQSLCCQTALARRKVAISAAVYSTTSVCGAANSAAVVSCICLNPRRLSQTAGVTARHCFLSVADMQHVWVTANWSWYLLTPVETQTFLISAAVPSRLGRVARTISQSWSGGVKAGSEAGPVAHAQNYVLLTARFHF